MKKKLVFSFSVFNDCLNNRAIKIHLKCLKYYANVFDEALFVLNDDENDNNNTDNNTADNFIGVKQQLISLPFKNIQIIEKKGNCLYESQVFYDNVITKLNSFNDTLIFFGHTKGCTNYNDDRFNKDNIDTWITALYFLSLFDINDVENQLIKQAEPRFFGSLLAETKDDNINNLPNEFPMYQGNFFWLNPGRIYNDIITSHTTIPQFYDRWFTEYLPGKMYPDGHNNNIIIAKYGRYTYLTYQFNTYLIMNKIIDFTFENVHDDKQQFLNFKNTILNDIE